MPTEDSIAALFLRTRLISDLIAESIKGEFSPFVLFNKIFLHLFVVCFIDYFVGYLHIADRMVDVVLDPVNVILAIVRFRSHISASFSGGVVMNMIGSNRR
jgi:hypothetical protein